MTMSYNTATRLQRILNRHPRFFNENVGTAQIQRALNDILLARNARTSDQAPAPAPAPASYNPEEIWSLATLTPEDERIRTTDRRHALDAVRAQPGVERVALHEDRIEIHFTPITARIHNFTDDEPDSSNSTSGGWLLDLEGIRVTLGLTDSGQLCPANIDRRNANYAHPHWTSSTDVCWGDYYHVIHGTLRAGRLEAVSLIVHQYLSEIDAIDVNGPSVINDEDDIWPTPYQSAVAPTAVTPTVTPATPPSTTLALKLADHPRVRTTQIPSSGIVLVTLTPVAAVVRDGYEDQRDVLRQVMPLQDITLQLHATQSGSFRLHRMARTALSNPETRKPAHPNWAHYNGFRSDFLAPHGVYLDELKTYGDAVGFIHLLYDTLSTINVRDLPGPNAMLTAPHWPEMHEETI